MASPTRWTWVWVNSGSWWWTGRPGVLWFMGSQRVGQDWATEVNWTELNLVKLSLFPVVNNILSCVLLLFYFYLIYLIVSIMLELPLDRIQHSCSEAVEYSVQGLPTWAQNNLFEPYQGWQLLMIPWTIY